MKYFLTLDIGGTDLKYGVINTNEELVFKAITPTNGHLGASVLMNTIKELFNNLSVDYKLEGIAISTTGAIDDNTNVLFENLSIVDYDKINFRNELKDLGVLIAVENDVNSMGLCENSLVLGHENMHCLLAMTVGTGIGGAVFIKNELHKGFAYTAGEWGKSYVTANGDTYENMASVSSLVKNAQQINSNVKSGLDVFNLYDKGDEAIAKVVNKFYNSLAYGIASLVYTLNPDHIVIGGGITNRGDLFLEELREHLKGKLVPYLYEKLSISIAVHKNDAGMIGAFKNFKLTFNV